MDNTEDEFSEWVVIQNSPTSSSIDTSSPPNSPILQQSHHLENPPEKDDDDDFVVPIVGEEEGESSSIVNLSMPWRVIETAKKRLIKDSGFLFKAVEKVRCNYVTHRKVFWSISLIGGFVLVSSLVYVKLMRWWRRLQEEKLRFLVLLLREKDQKIKELMLEIERLNERLSARRRVRVVRIV